MNKWAIIAISSITDALITAGTAYLTVAQSGELVPLTGQIIACVIGGVIAGARSVQKMMSQPPQ